MFDQKKLVLSVCFATCTLALAACGSDDNSNGSSELGNACDYTCNDVLAYNCVDVLNDGHKVCVNRNICQNGNIDVGNDGQTYETDVDCGGYCANINFGNDHKCAIDKKCKVNEDCVTGQCDGGKCVTKGCNTAEDCGTDKLWACDDNICTTCGDGVKNHDESDIDCGGWCGATCKSGQTCSQNSDCETNQCEGGQCKGEIPSGDPSKLLVNEIYHGTSSSNDFLLNINASGATMPGTCDFIEVASLATEAMSLDGMTLTLLRTDDGKGTTVTVPLSGVIQPKQVLVIHSCNDLPLPAGTLEIKMTLGLTGKAYDIAFANGDNVATSVSLEGFTYSISFNRAVDYDATASFTKTDSVPGAITDAKASPGYCVNGGTFSTGCVAACSNGKLDPFETDKDCGRACGATCEASQNCKHNTDCVTEECDSETKMCVIKSCTQDSDCSSNKCSIEDGAEKGICISCGDQVKNNDETDVDCGGWCGAKCQNGQTCATNADCVTNECGSDNKCTGEVPEPAKLNDLVINEVLVTAEVNKDFDYLKGNKQCEFIEIVNVSANPVSLNNVTMSADNITDSKQAINAQKLTGILPSKTALVLHNIEQCPLDDMHSVGTISQNLTKNVLTNNKTFKIYLTIDGVNSTEFIAPENLAASHSANLTIDMDATSAIVDHETLHGAMASPGMCANGGSFVNDCVLTCENGVKDDDEMGTDCGGVCAVGCANGTACTAHTDCLSGHCNDSGKCDVAPCTSHDECGVGGVCNGTCERCDDHIQNGNETDIDCGGTCENKCEIGDRCEMDSDCATSSCDPTTHRCVKSDCEDPAVGEIVINEVFNKVKASANMELTTENKQTEFIELYNKSSKKLSLNGLSININAYANATRDGVYDSKYTYSIPLSGCLEANKYLLVYSASADKLKGLPSTAVEFPTASMSSSNALVNTRSIDMLLSTNSTTIHKVVIAIPKEQYSDALEATPNKDSDGYDIMVQHNTIQINDTQTQTYKHTPGASNYYTDTAE